MDKISVIVVAGGKGKRMGTKVPKQFLLLRNRPVLMHTLERLAQAFGNLDLRLILVLNSEFFDYWQELKQHYDFNLPLIEITGGKERFHSVKNGLTLAFDTGIIAVHDAVRPFVTNDFLRQGLNLAQEKDSAVPYVLPKSSVRIEENGENRQLDRSKLRIIQTPQFFNAGKLKSAYNTDYKPVFTDDATVYEYAGNKIHLFKGLENNIKITTEADYFLARYLIEKN